MPTYKLTYFDVFGRGELLRLIMTIGNQPFEEVRYSFLEWPLVKGSDANPNKLFGSLPFLEITHDDGSKLNLAQSLVISRYLAREFNLAGKTAKEQLEVEMYMEHADDLLRAGGALPFQFNPEIKEKLIKKFLNDTVPMSLEGFEKRLESTKTGFLVGDELTAADIYFTVVIDHHSQILPDNLLAEFPLCQKLYKNVKEQPAIAKWQAEHPNKGPVKLLEEVNKARL